MKRTDQLRGSHVVVFGGSSGIGAAVAAAANAAGARVTILGRDADRLATAAATIAGARMHTVDISDERSVNHAAAAIDDPTHVVLTAAGFVGGGILELDVARARTALDSRVWGAVHVVRALAPRMAGPSASFVFTGGISTDRPAPGAWATSLATAAVEQLARCLARELAPLRFNAIAPGWTDTPMWDQVLGAAREPTLAATAEAIPIRRVARPDEVADAVLTLLANESINGETLHVDGGHRLT
jgi:NAD(P)-dependent dehydrogenase (short-subunit alcohol dehydrogenase family)